MYRSWRRFVGVQSLWLLSLALGPGGCHANPHTPAAGTGSQPSPLSSSTSTAAQAPDGVAQTHLSVTQLRLPLAAPDAAAPIRLFFAAATRAVRHTFEDDIDDPSQLLALRQRLGRDASLVQVRSLWQPILDASLVRADTLRVLGPTLRALRQALANTWRDEMNRTYRDIDAASCRNAQAQLPTQTRPNTQALQDTVVTIEPVGAYPLSTLLRFCEEPRSLFGRE